MRCSNCGNEVANTSGVCPICGAPLPVDFSKEQNEGTMGDFGTMGNQGQTQGQNQGQGYDSYGSPDFSNMNASFNQGQSQAQGNQGSGFGNNYGNTGQNFGNTGQNGNMGTQPYWNGNPQYGHNQPYGQNLSAPSYDLYLILSVLYTILCCGLVIGGLSITFTVLMNQAYKTGDQDKYILYKRLVKWLLIGGVVLRVICIIYNIAALIGLIVGSPSYWTYEY